MQSQFLLFTLVCTGILLVAGCQLHGADPGAQADQTGDQRFTGTLESGVMAIGGETTGWRLVRGADAGGPIEVDVSRVRPRAGQLDGRRVTITGHVVPRQYVERGSVRVLVAESIEPARS